MSAFDFFSVLLYNLTYFPVDCITQAGGNSIHYRMATSPEKPLEVLEFVLVLKKHP